MKGLCAPSPWAEKTLPDLKVWAEPIVYLAREGMPASDKVVQVSC